MPTSPQTVPNWSALERKILEGGYELEQCLNPAEIAARFKVRILGDRFTEAIADVFAPGSVPRGQIGLWVEAAGLHHPNLNRPISTGELSVEGGQWPYFVRLRPDETLGTVLAERALTVDEAREVTRSITAALEYLHQNGYVHGGISPEHVLAMGDSIQLSTLHLHRANVPLGAARAGARFRAPESPLENSSPEADIYCLGCALYEILTGKKVSADAPADPVDLPQPFAYIVDRCLEPDPEKRLSLPAIQALLEGRQIAQPSATPEPEIHELAMAPVEVPMANGNGEKLDMVEEKHAVSAAPLRRESEPSVAAEPTPKPVIAAAPLFPAAASNNHAPVRPATAAGASVSDAEERIRARREGVNKPYIRPVPIRTDGPPAAAAPKPWIWVILAAVLLGGILWFARPKADAPRQPTVTTGADQSHLGNTGVPGGASHVVGPDGSTSTHTPASGSTEATAASGKGSAKMGTRGNVADERVWRVVVWTFARQADAERRVSFVKHKHLNLDPQVFTPHEHTSPYLVTLGGQMSRPEAERLRQKARAAGLPRDSYIQNYAH